MILSHLKDIWLRRKQGEDQNQLKLIFKVINSGKMRSMLDSMTY